MLLTLLLKSAATYQPADGIKVKNYVHSRSGLLLAVLDHFVTETNSPFRWNTLYKLDKQGVAPQVVHKRNPMHQPEHEIKPGM
jgi:hypothetical protein